MNMEYPFPSKVKAWPGAQLGEMNSAWEDPNIKFAELMNLDAYPGWCDGSTAMDHWLVSNGLSPLQPFPLGSFDSLNLVAEQPGYIIPSVDALSDAAGTSHNCVGNANCQQVDAQVVYPPGSNSGNQQESVMEEARCIVSRPVFGFSLDEKMLKALSFLREFSGDGILAQVWVPIRQGDQYVLSTSEQPYLLDKTLAGYREVSRTFNFSAEVKPGLPLGLPGRVFVSKVPEWTSNIVYYNKEEYVRVRHAVDHEVRGSIALPVLDSSGTSCCAVLELVTVKEKSNFDSEMENICQALQAVNLRSTLPPRLLPQYLSDNRRAALAEIMDVLRAVCHAHTLPLGLTWIPCNYTEAVDEIIRVRVREGSNSRLTGKSVLCIEDTACYVNDRSMQGFVHACVEHYIEEGQGIAGKALQSNHPFFIPDVKAYDITEYPHVHHSRKYGLNAAVAIRLRSTYTGDHDYILELFLPVNITGSQEQQLLLNSLSNTMQKICKSLRTVSDAELAAGEGDRVGYHKEASAVFPQISIPKKNSQPALSTANLDTAGMVDCDASSSRMDRTESGSQNCRATTGSRKQLEKKKNTAEKNVSLSVLQQYFSGSLKDAAKSIGVCPTTLKRICRHHGISRWPSRKINKVNRSLKKIQTVLDSVQGVEGGLKFDPSTGGFTAGPPTIDELDSDKSSPFDIHHPEPLAEPAPFAVVKIEDRLIDTTTIPSIDGSEEDSKSRRCGPHEIAQLEKSSSQPPSWSDNSSSRSSRESESMHGGGGGGCSSSSQTFEEGTARAGWKIVTVKASYKEDTIRFKFDPSAGCFQLYEEVGKRFKLQTGTFQLKYMDDEEEWVLLTNDSDLQECCEILDYVGKESVKLVVRDVPFTAGSSGSSNCFLAGSSQACV